MGQRIADKWTWYLKWTRNEIVEWKFLADYIKAVSLAFFAYIQIQINTPVAKTLTVPIGLSFPCVPGFDLLY